jgi:hypothetical protein
MNFLDWLKDFAPIVTAVGVGVAAIQLWNTKRQAVTTFEDSLASEYRQITARLPTSALLGEALSVDLSKVHLGDFYLYFDLCNTQIFLRQIGRINGQTWRFWADGIRTNLSRPAFAAAWTDIARRSNKDFSELRRCIAEGFMIDPKKWPKA